MTRRLPRTLLSTALVAGALGIAVVAHAEQGTIVLTTGEILSGDISEVVNGDHVVIKTPNGEVRAVAWIAIGTLQIGAGGQIVVHPAGAQPPPPPPPPNQPPPPVVYAPPPPPPAYAYPPPAPPPPPPRFHPRLQIGARLSSLVPGGNLVGTDTFFTSTSVPMSDYVKPGVGFEGDLGFHFSPAWTFYGFWELGFLERGDKNANATQTPISNFIGLGFKANTNPRGSVGFLIDLGFGYRWLSLPTPNVDGSYQRTTYGGFEPLRIGLGLNIAIDRQTSLEVMVVGSTGVFSTVSSPSDPNQCGTASSSNANLCTVSNTGWHTFGGLTVGAHFDL